MITAQRKKQTYKQADKKTKKQKKKHQTTETDYETNVCTYSSNSSQWKKFNEVCCCICKTVENSEMYVKSYFQHRY